MDKNCLTCEHGSHFNNLGFKCSEPKSEFYTSGLGADTFFLIPKENCKEFLVKFNIMRDFLQKHFDKMVNIIEERKVEMCMVENKITGLNGNIELNKTTEFSKPIIINGVITNYNKVYVTFSDEKFKLSIYSDTNSAHNVTTIDYDSKIYAMNIVEKETHIDIEIYPKFG